MELDYYIACGELLGITLPKVDSYDYGTLYKALRPPDQEAIWDKNERLRRQALSWSLVDLLHDETARDIPDDILYVLCKWYHDSWVPQGRSSANCMAHHATVGMWNLDMIKRLWGRPGTLSSEDAGRLMEAIVALRVSVGGKVDRAVASHTIANGLVNHYATDIKRVTVSS